MQNNDIEKQLQEQVKDAAAAGEPLRIRGGDSRAFLGRAVEAPRTLDTRDHSGIVLYEPSELAITVRGGTPLRVLIDALAAEHQELPFEPPAFGGESTIGGAVASGLAGPRRPWNGAVRDALLGVKLVNGKGEVLQFGGQVMKNVAGYDLSRPMAGAHGTLGLLLEVSLKLKPLPPASVTLVREEDKRAALETMRQLYQRPGNLSGVAWVDGLLHLRLEGYPEAIEARAAELGGERLDDAAGFWRSLNNQTHPFFAGDTPLWRLVVKPASGDIDPPGKELIDWIGGQRWIRSDEIPQALRRLAASHGGHATRFRGTTEIDSPFHPLEPGLMALHRNLKRALDPQGLFNPDRMYEGL